MRDTCLPQAGDRLGTRTVICVKGPDCIIFGERENGIENCGAWRTDAREWFEYERSLDRS